MKKNAIKEKSFDFALKTIQAYKILISEKREFVLSKQFLRSGTAIGALVYEAEHAESKPDFIHKLAIAQKEANETGYWLELLFQSEYMNNVTFDILKEEVNQLKKILAAIIVSSKQRLGKT